MSNSDSKSDSTQPIDLDESVFKSIELVAYVKHAHTGTEIRDPSKIKVIELQEKDVVLEIPSKKFAVGHYLLIGINARNTTRKLKPFVGEGRIAELLPQEDTDQIRLTLTQFEQVRWDELRGVFEQRQQEIEEFLSNSRGY